MTILFICDEYPPGKNGGVGTMVQMLGRELVRQGHRVFVAGLYAYSYGGSSYEEDMGVKVWRFRYGLTLHLEQAHLIHKIFNRLPGFIKQRLNGKKAFARFIDFLQTLISSQKIDIIEAPDWNTFAMRIGFKVQWPAFSVPFTVKLHGSYTFFAHETKTPCKSWLRATDEALLKRADALCAVSAYTARRSTEIFGISPDIKILYNAIEPLTELPAEKKQRQEVIFTGTLIARKGIFQLAKAWNQVHAVLPQAKLVIYGKGNTHAVKKLLAPTASNSVSFAGHVARAQLLEALAGATLAVFPSYSETFGLAVIEAMAAGCPVIFTKRASGPEIITDKINGELAEPDQVEEISSAIIRILNSPALQSRYAISGKETVHARFNIQHSAHEHIRYYTEAIHQFNIKKAV